jgi:hypothetical protein
MMYFSDILNADEIFNSRLEDLGSLEQLSGVQLMYLHPESPRHGQKGNMDAHDKNW